MTEEKIKKSPFRCIAVDNKKEEIIEERTILAESAEKAQRSVEIDMFRRNADLSPDDAEVIVKPF